jgi:hypothetical protein
MYTTIRNIAGGFLMRCSDCGHTISMNKMCETPIQSATEILKHIAAHNASRAFAGARGVNLDEPRADPTIELPVAAALGPQLGDTPSNSN